MKKNNLITEIDYDERTKEKISEETYELTKKAIFAALSGYGFDKGWQVSVSFVDEDEIKSLNKTYRNVDKVTDVLSFPMEDSDERGVELLGDVVICNNVAKAQAELFNHSVEREVAYLTVHSILHLLGYDHEEEEDRAEMRMAEKEIMKSLGIFKHENEYED